MLIDTARGSWRVPLRPLLMVLLLATAAARVAQGVLPVEAVSRSGMADAVAPTGLQSPGGPEPVQTHAGVETDGRRWSLAAPGLPRAAAAQQLVDLSRTELHDPQGLLAATADRRLVHWPAPGLGEAWQALLGSDLASASYCLGAGRCHVWVFGASDRQASGIGPAHRPNPLLQADPPGLFPAEGT